MAKRITSILDDSKSKDLHDGRYGRFDAHQFEKECTKHEDSELLRLGLGVWDKLGNPSKVRVTITSVE